MDYCYRTRHISLIRNLYNSSQTHSRSWVQFLSSSLPGRGNPWPVSMGAAAWRGVRAGARRSEGAGGRRGAGAGRGGRGAGSGRSSEEPGMKED